MEQGLPVAFENNASTWQNMPGMAALYTGIQNQLSQDNIRALQQAFAREQAFKEQERPVTLQNLVSTGELQKAQASQALANARNLNNTAGFDEATMPGKIGATNAKNTAEVAESGTKQLNAEAARYEGLAAIAADPVRPAWEKAQIIQKHLGLNDQEAQHVLRNMAQMPGLFKKQADFVYQNSAAAKALATKEAGDTARNAATNAANIQIGAGHDAASRYGSEARVGAAKAKEDAFNFDNALLKLSPSKQIAALEQRAALVQETNPELAASYLARANSPTLRALAQAEYSGAGASTVTQQPGQRPEMVPKATQVPLPMAGPQQPSNGLPGGWKVEVVK